MGPMKKKYLELLDIAHKILHPKTYNPVKGYFVMSEVWTVRPLGIDEYHGRYPKNGDEPSWVYATLQEAKNAARTASRQTTGQNLRTVTVVLRVYVVEWLKCGKEGRSWLLHTKVACRKGLRME